MEFRKKCILLFVLLTISLNCVSACKKKNDDKHPKFKLETKDKQANLDKENVADGTKKTETLSDEPVEDAGDKSNEEETSKGKKEEEACHTSCSSDFCENGNLEYGGKLLNTADNCEHFCVSSVIKLSNRPVRRFCGDGDDYKEGDYIDCRACTIKARSRRNIDALGIQ